MSTMKQNKEVKNEKVLSLKGNTSSAEAYLGQEHMLHVSLVENQGLSIKATDVWNKNFDKIVLYMNWTEPSIGMSASFNGVLNNEETLNLLWQLQEGQCLVNMLNLWLEKRLKNAMEFSGSEVVENSVPLEYDVKVGDIVEVTKYRYGNPVGALVKVVEVNTNSSKTCKLNSVETINGNGLTYHEDDVKLFRKKTD